MQALLTFLLNILDPDPLPMATFYLSRDEGVEDLDLWIGQPVLINEATDRFFTECDGGSCVGFITLRAAVAHLGIRVAECQSIAIEIRPVPA